MSLNQFLNKCRKWADMRKLPDSFRSKISRLERNFAVSKVIFTKYLPMFKEMFRPPDLDELLMHVRHNKKKMIHCTPTKVFEFTWILFVLTKAEYLDVSNDLVSSFHLLIATCDLIYANVIQSKLRDIVNPEFEGMPQNFLDSRFVAPEEPPCSIGILCRHHDGLHMEAKSIKEYCWRNYMSKLLSKQKLRGNYEDLSRLLEQENFDFNFKVVNKMYEEYILSVGDFDERIFLPKFPSFDATHSASSTEDHPEPLPLPSTPSSLTGGGGGHAPPEVDFGIDFTSFRPKTAPRTPLTGRHYLSTRDLEHGISTPVKSATQSVSRLNLLCGRDPAPSPALTRIFQSCESNPTALIDSVLSCLGEKFTRAYASNAEHSRDFAEKRLSVAVCLYYKLLESILTDEQKKPSYDFNVLLSLRVFHETLFACCLEIVIFCYNSNRTFPWILSVLNIDAYHFYKVIEVIVRAEQSLSRDIVNHLNLSEEQVLDSLAWASASPLWRSIENSGQEIPVCEHVTLPSQLRSAQVATSSVNVASTGPGTGGVTPVSDRFQSPVTRRDTSSVLRVVQGGPARVIVPPLHPITSSTEEEEEGAREGEKDVPQRKGSLGLFFRKFYHLAFVRMEELCSQLHIDDEELKHKIWTCFEYSITHGIDNDGEHIMKDRHVDQLVMSAVYIICKVANSPSYEKTFTEIMKCYRHQPQSSSNVYRLVLLSRKHDERGDLIKFYNMVYVKVMQEFARKFSRSMVAPELLTLSPLPRGRAGNGGLSPYRRVSDKFGLFIRSLEHTVFPATPASHSNTYLFTRSPAKDLLAINDMIRSDFDSAAPPLYPSPSPPVVSGGGLHLLPLPPSRKRPLLPPLLDPLAPESKRVATAKPLNKKLAALVGERQSVLMSPAGVASSPNDSSQ